jgi:4-hydroxy-tetrahydrodipicolinate synthase
MEPGISLPMDVKIAIHNRLQGVVVPILTPLLDDTTIDETAFRSLLRRCHNGGVHGLFVGGTAGLGPLLTDWAVTQLLEIAQDEAGDDLPLLAGVIETSTPRAINRIRQVEALGYKQFVITPAFYLAIHEHEEFLAHFGACRDATDMEMVLYNIPVCTGSCIPIETILEMRRRGWITTVKDSSGDMGYFSALCQRGRDSGLKVFQGLKPELQRLVELGASGVVPVPANLDPRTFTDAWDAAWGSDPGILAPLQTRIDLLWDTLVKGTDFMSRTLCALSELGIGSGHVMTPFESAPAEEHERIRGVIPDTS